MKAVTKITFYDDEGGKFFGEGPARLLRGIAEKGSLRASALSMEMAYTKALTIIKNAENALGFPLLIRSTGGKSGGGSKLTDEGKAWLERYEAYRDACIQANRRLYQEFFPAQVGCVIMASGLGNRFGGNKLMADFLGKPMISRVLDATEGLFSNRVVVTRHTSVADLCKERGIPVVLHDLPHRSDTVRLGLEAIGDVERCMFCPGDQPLLTRETIEFLLLSASNEPEAIWRPCWDSTPGSPVLFPRWTFPELRTLPEGKGGGAVIKRYPEKCRMLNISTPQELQDADTPEILEQLRQYAINQENWSKL